MLKFSYLYEDYDLAAKALSLWMPSGAREALDWYRISANAIYAVRVPEGGMRFLRLAPSGEKRAENLRAEYEFLVYLAKNGYPAAQMLPSLGGAPIEMLTYKGETWYASYFEGAKGERSDRIPWSDETAFAYGAALGKLHALSQKYVPATRAWSYENVIEHAVGILQGCGEPPETIRAAEKLERALSHIPRTKENFGLLHCDFEPDNVFFSDGKPEAIDFESGYYFFYPCDLRIAVDSLDDAVDESQLSQMEARVVEGYESVLPLDRELYGRVELPLLNDLRGLADIVRCLSDPPIPNEPEWAKELRGTLAFHAKKRREKLLAYAGGRAQDSHVR